MILCSPVPYGEAVKIKRCGNTINFTLFSGFSHCLGMDKTIAPHQTVYRNLTKYKVGIYQVWVLLLSSSCHFKFCEILRIEDNFNNTLSLIMSFQLANTITY